jgi:hypothetical protein
VSNFVNLSRYNGAHTHVMDIAGDRHVNTINLQQIFYHDSLLLQKGYEYDLFITLKIRAAAPVRTRISDEISFLLCQSCFWCASYFNLIELTIINCPQCHSNRIEQLLAYDNQSIVESISSMQ